MKGLVLSILTKNILVFAINFLIYDFSANGRYHENEENSENNICVYMFCNDYPNQTTEVKICGIFIILL